MGKGGKWIVAVLQQLNAVRRCTIATVLAVVHRRNVGLLPWEHKCVLVCLFHKTRYDVFV